MTFPRVWTLLLFSGITVGLVSATNYLSYPPITFWLIIVMLVLRVLISVRALIQNNKCNESSLCVNFAPDGPNIQSNGLSSVSLCSNIGEGISNVQLTNCKIDTLCQNVGHGDSSDQLINCKRVLFCRK